MNRSTTVLPPQGILPNTRELTKPKRRKAFVVIAVLVSVVLALGVGGVLVVSAYLYLLRKNTAANTTAIQSVAVLPFKNESGNADFEYLSDGITESLINSLSQLPNLSVKARSTVFHYKGKDVTSQRVGSELSVQAVLNGWVTQHGDQLTLSLELVDARTGNQIWGEQYNRTAADLVSLQSEIAHDVSNKLRVKLSGADEQKLAKNYTTNAEAYQFYLRGRFYWNKRTAEGMKKAIEQFQQAIEKDPTYALAYAGLADAYSTLPGYSATPASEVAPKARAAASRSIELDPNLAEAHASLGYIMMGLDSDPAGAEKELRRAIELNPNYPTAHHWYGLLLGSLGRFDEAKREILRAQQLDPLSLIINRTIGTIFFWAREYDQALVAAQKTLEIDPNFPPAHEDLAVIYGMKGRYEEAISEMNKAISLNGRLPHYVAALGSIHANSGHKVEAQRMLNELLAREKTEYVSSADIAFVYVALGEKEKAFERLEEAIKDVTVSTNVNLKVGPAWDPLRSDPRFADLLRRAGLPQ